MTTAPAADVATITASLVEKYGWILGSQDLTKALGYRTYAAFNKAASRSTLPVQTFTIAGRRGRFALAPVVAAWLATVGQQADPGTPRQKGDAP